MGSEKWTLLLNNIKSNLIRMYGKENNNRKFLPDIDYLKIINKVDFLITFFIHNSLTNPYDSELMEMERLYNVFFRLESDDAFMTLCDKINDLYRTIAMKKIETKNISESTINEIKKQISDLQKAISNLDTIDYVKEKQKIEENLQYIYEKKKITDELVGDVANTKQTIEILAGEKAESKNTEKYTKFAEDNKNRALLLFISSLIIMFFVSILATFLFWDFSKHEGEQIWIRLPIVILILMPAFFMMRESKKLKDKEFQYYDMACRIITSAPYIDGLNISPEEKGKLKADLVKDFFARPIECLDDGGAMPLSEIQKFVDSCAKLKK